MPAAGAAVGLGGDLDGRSAAGGAGEPGSHRRSTSRWPNGAPLSSTPRKRAGRCRAARRATGLTVLTPGEEEAGSLAAAERQAIRALLARPEPSEQECEDYRRRALSGGEPRLRERLGFTGDGHEARARDARRWGFDSGEQVLWAESALRSFGLVGGFARLVLLAGHGSRTENNAYAAAPTHAWPARSSTARRFGPH